MVILRPVSLRCDRRMVFPGDGISSAKLLFPDTTKNQERDVRDYDLFKNTMISWESHTSSPSRKRVVHSIYLKRSSSLKPATDCTPTVMKTKLSTFYKAASKSDPITGSCKPV